MSGSALPALAQAGPTSLQRRRLPPALPPQVRPLPPTPPGADSALADQGAHDAAQPDNGGLQEIVVTATKRETNLQKTPIAISVATAQALEDRSVQSLLDLGDGSIPGLRVATFEARQSAVTIGIRGIVPLDANQPAREQGVGVYLDGVDLGRQQGLGAALLDVERIEVRMGLQGTLFGRNTSGGAISMVTKAPTGRFGLRASLGAGNYDSRSGNVHLDLPAAGPFSFKIDAAADYRDGITKNPMPGERDFGYYDRKGMQLKRRSSPAPASPATSPLTWARTRIPRSTASC